MVRVRELVWTTRPELMSALPADVSGSSRSTSWMTSCRWRSSCAAPPTWWLISRNEAGCLRELGLICLAALVFLTQSIPPILGTRWESQGLANRAGEDTDFSLRRPPTLTDHTVLEPVQCSGSLKAWGHTLSPRPLPLNMRPAYRIEWLDWIDDWFPLGRGLSGYVCSARSDVTWMLLCSQGRMPRCSSTKRR